MKKNSDRNFSIGPIKISWDPKSKSGLVLIPILRYLAFLGKVGS